jgi:hypothetical protein
MSDIDDLVQELRSRPQSIRFNDLVKVCNHYFGEPRQKGTSHKVYKTPWAGDPRVNIQDKNGKAKPYQVRQVLKAIERLQKERNDD